MPKSFGTPKIGNCSSTEVPQYMRAAERVLVGPERQVARPDAGCLEAAHQVRAHVEMVEHAQVFAAPAGDVAALHAQHDDDVGHSS